MNITRAAIVNNRTSWTLLLVITFFGLWAYQNMPKDYDPGFIIRTAQVITYFPGASPERVEQLVTDKLEKVIQEIPELDYVNSESRTGVSIISVNIKESYKVMRPIWDNLRRKIEAATSELPADAQSPIVNDEFGDVFGIVIGVTAEGYTYGELENLAEQIKDDLLRLDEAAKVDIFGIQEERIFIEYNNSHLSELGLSPSQLSEQLTSRNIVNPGGTINIDDEQIALEPTGNFESVEEIKKTVINLPGSDQVLYLEDIAQISRGYVDPAKTKVSVSGERAMSIAISMRKGGNNIHLGEQVTQAINEFYRIYPIGVDFHLVSYLPKEVEQKVDNFISNLLQAIAVVTLVMLFFLGLRTGLIVAVLIPASMIFAILVMSFFDIGIDQISLAALIIALGMLVDNGIVMSESIMVDMENGKKPIAAAVDSANELKVPLLTSSLTTAAAFLPIFLAESTTGEYTASLFKVVTITLLCSWILSMTIIPMLCVYFMKIKKQRQHFNQGIYRIYHQILDKFLAYRGLTLSSTLVILVIAMMGLNRVPKLFFPPSDRPYFKVELELPLGTHIDAMDGVVKEIEAFIEKELAVGSSRNTGVTTWISYTGSGGPRFLLTHNPKPFSANYALMIINTSSFEVIDKMISKLDQYTFNHFPDLLVKLRKIENGAAIANPVEVRVSGKDSRILFEYVDLIKQQFTQIDGLKSISDNWGLPIKKLKVKINQARAKRAGISSKDIAISLQTGLSGLELTQYRENDDVIPIMMRSTAADRQDIGKLEALAVYSQATGIAVPLKQVADIEMVWEAANIMRRDRLKTVTVGAQLENDVTANEAFEQLLPWLKKQQSQWAPGYRFELGGEAESSGKANRSIVEKLPVAVLIIVLLLVAQFNSIRQSIIVLVTIPLGLIGVTVGLLVGQSFFGFMTLLGIISLAGIVINNAIVLLERIKIEREANPDNPIDAIIEAAKRRMRPILLTTATTVFGLVPLYLGGGEMWEPMALSIIGGLLFSTLLTLGVVPVLYALLFGVKHNR
ncbi:efflux RND transporter permease subunit [Aliikangiella maris]|uniref:Efflux RND transporter permease subunit n=1 Tax=Aliikangiella maris TaxID=3162458 RepID=A0ABV2BW25_9GAMM